MHALLRIRSFLCLLMLSGLACAALASPPQASATHGRIAVISPVDADPRLAGRDVILGESGRDKSVRLLALRDGRTRLLRRLPKPRYGKSVGGGFAASRFGIAYSRTEEKPVCDSCFDDTVTTELGVVTARGQHRRLAYCRGLSGGRPCPYPHLVPPVDISDVDIQVSGARVGFQGYEGIVIRRLTAGRSTPVVVPLAQSEDDPFRTFSLAGPRVAFEEVAREDGKRVVPNRSSLVIFDWTKNRPLYRVALPDGAILDSFALQADGKIAFSYQFLTPRGGLDPLKRVAWASPAEPQVHPVPLPGGSVSEDSGIFFSNDRIAVTRGGIEGVERRFRQRFLVSDLSGRILRSFTFSRQGLLNDFDGRCLLWTQRRSQLRTEVYLARIDRRPPRRSACS